MVTYCTRGVGCSILVHSAALLCGCIFFTGIVVIPKLSAAGFTQEKNIVYGHKHGLGLLMDVFSPEEQNGAGVIWVISGGMNSSRHSIPKLNKNIDLIVGYIQDTLDDFLKKHNPKINFVKCIFLIKIKFIFYKIYKFI